MSNNTKPKAPTAEELRQQQVRALAQQRTSLAQGVLFNALHNPALDPNKTAPADLADWSVAVAEALMDSLYRVPKETPAEQ